MASRVAALAGDVGPLAGWLSRARAWRPGVGQGGDAEAETFFEALVDPVQVVDAQGRLLFVNQAWRETLGYEDQDLARLTLGDLVAPESRAHLLEAHDKVLGMGIADTVELTFVARDGARVALAGSINPRRQRGRASGRAPTTWSVLRRVSDIAMVEAALVHQATHDPLTELPNRALFLDRLAQSLARAARRGGTVAVLFLDLDRFKVVNDSLGHDAGDVLLSSVGERLLNCIRPSDTAARLGGDEFTLLLEDLPNGGEAVRVAERVTEELRGPFPIGGHQVVVSASIGIALSTPEQGRPADLLHQADVAMYAAKKQGREGYALFDDAMHRRAVARFTLEEELRRAVERGEFAVYYQPIARLETGRIVGMEALVRWQHPERGLVPPDQFIALAEETGLILPIGRWVLGEACRQGRLWRDQHPDDPPSMAVNLCVRQFTHPDLVTWVAEALRHSGLEARLLELEITESTVMEAAAANVATLRALTALGASVAIDDFGTGYSSLAYLRRFPVGAVKIDRSFVGGLGRNPEDAEIVRAVVTLAQALSLQVTAEGVETAEQLAELRRLGCDRGQGYYFWRPRPASAAGALLTTDLRAVREASTGAEPD